MPSSTHARSPTHNGHTRPSRSRVTGPTGMSVARLIDDTARRRSVAGAAYDVLHSYDPLFWAFVVLSAIPVGAVLLARR